MDNNISEQQVRQEAIRRCLEGERRSDICRDLDRSPGWFSKWWAEYQHNPKTDFGDRSRTPHRSPTQTPAHVEQAVVTVRQILEAAETQETRYGLIGHRAIRAELQRLGVKPLPSQATIQRILARQELTHRRGASTDSAYYPELVAWAPNAIQATDIITRHIRGGEVVQNFHTFDHDSHAVHLTPSADKTSGSALAHLKETWADLGLPVIHQLDNEQGFSGGHTHPRVIGRVVRLCLFVGVEVLFIPFYEAKRNYWVEGFHSLWLTAFWSRQEFRHVTHVRAQVPTFLQWYHTRYQPPSLQGQTPAQMRRGFQPVRLTKRLQQLIPDPLPITAGRLHFIRKVDMLGHIKLLNETWPVGQKWMGAYVWATVDTTEQTLTIWHQAEAEAPWRRIKTRRFKLQQVVQPLLPAFRRRPPRCRDRWPS